MEAVVHKIEYTFPNFGLVFVDFFARHCSEEIFFFFERKHLDILRKENSTGIIQS